MPGIDSYTQLLLHCDGIDGSTSFPDSSEYGRTITPIATAQIDTDITDSFGGNDGVLLCDGNSDYLNVTDFTELDLGSDDFTFDFWVRFNSISGNQGFITREVSGSSYFYVAWESGIHIRFRDYGGTFDTAFSWSPSINTWYHIALVRTGNNIKCFANGTQIGSTASFSGSFINRDVPLYIGAFPLANYWLNGCINEFRFSKGIARWTENFTPPNEPYSGDEVLNIEETVSLNDEWNIQTNPETQNIEETITLDDEWLIYINPEQENIEETLTIEDNWNVSTVEYSYFASKIISYNPLIYVTNSNPAKIVKVDITDPENPVKYTYEIINNSYAKDISYNSTNEYFYVACANGKVVKININDLEDQTIIDLSDIDNLLTISTFNDKYLTYVSSEDINGELYLIDEREVFTIDTDFKYLTSNQFVLENQFNFIEAFKIDTDFQYLQTNNYLLKTDFKWLANTFDEINPIAQTDFHVYIDDVELGNNDLVLDSISITHRIDEKSQASFTVARHHDDINSPLDGGTVTLTNQNNVKIYIGSNLEFNGKISNLSCIYSKDQEVINITATMNQPDDNRKSVTLSLPDLNGSLKLYDILVQNPVIYNPYIGESEEYPEIYKGVKVDLGTKIVQSISRYRFIETTINNKGVIASSIENGTFENKQNWQYFWLATAKNVITNIQWFLSRYIGTSLSSLTSDTWELIGTPYFRQRQWTDEETELGEYTVGSAPYLEVAVKNGKLIAVDKWVDKDDGFYLEKDESYDYINYAKEVANLEYSKLLNINSQVLPLTSASMEISIDAYYYYALKLLTRLNVDNTTSANIFNNNNGFPVSIKSIVINSSDMKIRLDTSNSQSLTELEEIDNTYPNEESDEYLFPAESKRISRKYDPNLDKYIE